VRVLSSARHALPCIGTAIVLLYCCASSASCAEARWPSDVGRSRTATSTSHVGTQAIDAGTSVSLLASAPLFDTSSNSTPCDFLSISNLVQGSFIVGRASNLLVILDDAFTLHQLTKSRSEIDIEFLL
jgi:hypothetical protein